MKTIEILLNGEKTNVPTATSLADALQRWGYTNSRIAIARNKTLVQRHKYERCILQAGDQLEVVAPFSGG